MSKTKRDIKQDLEYKLVMTKN